MATYYKRDSGSDWNSSSSWSTVAYNDATNTGTYPQAGDTAYLVNGSSNCTINVASACAVVDCTGYTNTLTMSSTMTTTGNVTLVSGMTFTPNTNTWELGTNGVTLTTNGKQFYKLKLNGPTGTLTLSGDCTCTGRLEVAAGNGQLCTFTGGDFYAAGLYSSANSDIRSSTRKIVLTGGRWSREGYNNEQVQCNLEIAGDVTVYGDVKFHAYGTDHIELKYVSGTVTTTGSILYVYANGEDAGGQVTLNTNGIEWNYVYFTYNFYPVFVFASAFKCAYLMCPTNSNITVSGSDIDVTGFARIYSMTSNTSTQTLKAHEFITVTPSLTIHLLLARAGVSAVNNQIYIYDKTVTHTSGVVDTYLALYLMTASCKLDLRNIHTWREIRFKASGIELLSDAKIEYLYHGTGAQLYETTINLNSYTLTLTGGIIDTLADFTKVIFTGTGKVLVSNPASHVSMVTSYITIPNLELEAGTDLTLYLVDLDLTELRVTGLFTCNATANNRSKLSSSLHDYTVFSLYNAPIIGYLDVEDIYSGYGTYKPIPTYGTIVNSNNWITAVSGPTNLKTLNTNALANIQTINTNAIANVKTLNTIS